MLKENSVSRISNTLQIFNEFDFSTNYEDKLNYSGKQLYQYHEDEFFIQVLIVNKLFSNTKFASNQREAFLIDSFS